MDSPSTPSSIDELNLTHNSAHHTLLSSSSSSTHDLLTEAAASSTAPLPSSSSAHRLRRVSSELTVSEDELTRRLLESRRKLHLSRELPPKSSSSSPSSSSSSSSSSPSSSRSSSPHPQDEENEGDAEADREVNLPWVRRVLSAVHRVLVSGHESHDVLEEDVDKMRILVEGLDAHYHAPHTAACVEHAASLAEAVRRVLSTRAAHQAHNDAGVFLRLLITDLSLVLATYGAKRVLKHEAHEILAFWYALGSGDILAGSSDTTLSVHSGNDDHNNDDDDDMHGHYVRNALSRSHGRKPDPLALRVASEMAAIERVAREGSDWDRASESGTDSTIDDALFVHGILTPGRESHGKGKRKAKGKNKSRRRELHLYGPDAVGGKHRKKKRRRRRRTASATVSLASSSTSTHNASSSYNVSSSSNGSSYISSNSNSSSSSSPSSNSSSAPSSDPIVIPEPPPAIRVSGSFAPSPPHTGDSSSISLSSLDSDILRAARQAGTGRFLAGGLESETWDASQRLIPRSADASGVMSRTRSRDDREARAAARAAREQAERAAALEAMEREDKILVAAVLQSLRNQERLKTRLAHQRALVSEQDLVKARIQHKIDTMRTRGYIPMAERRRQKAKKGHPSSLLLADDRDDLPPPESLDEEIDMLESEVATINSVLKLDTVVPFIAQSQQQRF